MNRRNLLALLLLAGFSSVALGQANYPAFYTFATLAGGQNGFTNGMGSAARFISPQGVVVDGAGNVYVADSGNHAIREVTPSGLVTTLVSGGALVSPYGLAVDSAMNLYVADYGAGAILKVARDRTGWKTSTLVSGLGAPYGVAVDGAANLYVTDGSASLIRKLTPIGRNWVVTTIAGPTGFDHPCGVAVDGATNLYVAGGSNNIIYKITPVGTNWVVTTLAGLAGVAGTNDGTGTNARFIFPAGVAVDAAANLYITDQSNFTIRKVAPAGTNWVVTTLAGYAGTSGTNDGTGGSAQFGLPAGVAIDAAGDLYVADSKNNTIRRGFPVLGAPVILTYGTGLVFSNGLFGFKITGAAGQSAAVDVSTNLLSWLAFWTNLIGPGVLDFSDSQSAASSRRFYRAHYPYPRRPLGVYAKVTLSDVIGSNTNADWNSYFDCLYGNLLSNPAISGLTLQVNWDLVNPAPNVYEWDYVTNAFNLVSNWNILNPQTPKTIQLIVTPGFNSPPWVLNNILVTNGSCDGMFTNGCPNCTNCGTVTFIGYSENGDGNVLPLPWNQIYKTAWSNFLAGLNQEFGDNPALVSIAVAGPTAVSAEMLLPNDTNTCPCQVSRVNPCDSCPTGTNAQPQSNGLLPSQMWNEMLAAHYGLSSTNSNQAFVTEWENAIDLYEEIFHNLTLVVTPANGEGFPFSLPTRTTDPLCQYNTNSSCTAVASILNYFENYQSVNGNGKASQVSGLKSSILTLESSDANIGGVKYLSAQWQTASPWDQILGGGQFNHPFSTGPTNGPLSPEQSEFDILANFFNGTRAITGTATFPGLFINVPGVSAVNPPLTNAAPLNYLQVYYQDVLYAESNGCVMINIAGTRTNADYISMSAQDLLNVANQLLFTIGQKLYPPGSIPSYAPTCSNLPPTACTPP